MFLEVLDSLSGEKLKKRNALLVNFGLEAEENVEKTVLLWDEETLVGCGSIDDNVLKLIAVDRTYQGQGISAKIVTALRQEAFKKGKTHLFLYTKPQNEQMFTDLFFYPVAKTENVLLMENKKDGVKNFVASLDKNKNAKAASAVVINGNPFTLGHRFLIEIAAKQSEHVYVFVLSEDKSEFSFAERFEMAKKGTEHLLNVTVLPTGPYLISSATFPKYFLKNRDQVQKIQCELDIEIFANYFAPEFNIVKRFVGSEPLSKLTNEYNNALKEMLPQKNIELVVIERLEENQQPVSASHIRKEIESGRIENIYNLVPQTTLEVILRRTK